MASLASGCEQLAIHSPAHVHSQRVAVSDPRVTCLPLTLHVWCVCVCVYACRLPLDDVFETHAHTYQRAITRWPTQPRSYLNINFTDCPISDPPELEIADPMLGISAGARYTQEWAVYGPMGGFETDSCNDYYCFINAVQRDIRVAARAPQTTWVNASMLTLFSEFNPIGQDREEWQLGVANFSMPWEHWSNATLDKYRECSVQCAVTMLLLSEDR
jgi:hypothetical protein